ncbi:TPA: hypothetical protein ACGSNH_001942 [Escherichia coli]|nr:hypothetical protein [Salmonella enterica subsp. enterica serovar Montevideo]EJT8386389.1 hypothetical protein [Salmonella enterica subsp. enterica serovar Montevideo]ELM0668195.1 hypothetical protein [Salmonella enterica subsp. enterica serovar Montevideo]
MNKLQIYILLGLLSGLNITTVQARDNSYPSVPPMSPRGPGPVINPENSQYMEEKEARLAKQIQHHQSAQEKRTIKEKRTTTKHHSEKKHNKKKH